MTNRMNTLMQLVLRQEQTVASLRQDMVVYLFVRSGPEGMIPVFCEAADKWRTMKEETPDKLTYSLKLTMFKQLLTSLHQRLTETYKDAEAMERGGHIELGGRTQELAAPPVEPSTAEVGGGQQLEASADGGPTGAIGAGTQGRDGGRAATIQVGEAVDEGCHGRVGSVPNLHIIASGGRATLEHAESVDRPGVVAYTGMQTSTRSPHLRQPDAASVEPDVSMLPSLKAVLKLVLHNPSNLCYLHSTIYAIHWTMLQVRLHNARTSLPATGVYPAVSTQCWRRILLWSHPGSQPATMALYASRLARSSSSA